MRQRSGRIVVAVAALLVAGVPALAAGFSFYEQSAKASGQAGAWVARADDAAANWYDPAALVHLEGGEVQLGANWLNIGSDTHFTINDPTAQFVSLTQLGVVVNSGQQFNAVANTATPAHFFYGQKINRRWAFGIGITNPFGLISQWQDIPMTLSSRKADLVTYLVNPNIAFALSDKWSFAVGADYLSTEVHSFSHDIIVGPGTTTVANLTGEGDSWGYNLALQFKSKCFAAAASYRSDFNPTIYGQVNVAGPLGNLLNSGASAKLNLPGQMMSGIAWTSDRVDVEFSGTYTQWNRFKELAIQTPIPQTTTTLTENWKAVWAYRLGVAVRLDKKKAHELRLGLVKDYSPIPVENLRPSIPDADRTGYTLGYGYNAKRWALDVYVMELKFADVTANGDFFAGVIDGTYSSSILLMGVTGKYRF